MAITALQQFDTRWRVSSKYVVDAAANTTVSLLDVSGLKGWETGGLVNIAKIYWTSSSPSGGLDIYWDATSNKLAFICEGTGGTYGYSPGQPAISNDAAAANRTGDVLITNASATFTLCIEYHKVSNAQGLGWSATDAVLGPPLSNLGG